MPKISLSKLAHQFEKQGCVVIRAHEHGNPDLIIISAAAVQAGVKVITIIEKDESNYLQNTKLEALRVQGLEVEFHYPDHLPKRTHEEVLASESEYQDIGHQDYINCRPMDNPFKKRSVEWYRFRANWEIGFNETEKIHHMLAKGPKTGKDAPKPE